mmetsp:Transcript_99080/g.285876  ORF Transcript_99080/g.285876 Transcript_99080/m.285876 type:complete len:468 (-) Transcript_99080:240-1643(-)
MNNSTGLNGNTRRDAPVPSNGHNNSNLPTIQQQPMHRPLLYNSRQQPPQSSLPSNQGNDAWQAIVGALQHQLQQNQQSQTPQTPQTQTLGVCVALLQSLLSRSSGNMAVPAANQPQQAALPSWGQLPNSEVAQGLPAACGASFPPTYSQAGTMNETLGKPPPPGTKPVASAQNAIPSSSTGDHNHANKFRNMLPCRSRGMPLDHNFKNAYFIITQDTAHGEDLVCSYPECQAAGSKFRYCKVCRIPISKRNFYQKHSHPDILMKGQISNELRNIRNEPVHEKRQTVPTSPFSPADESGSPVPSGARQLQVSGTKKEEPPPFKGQLKDDQVSQKPSPKSICIAEQKRIERRKAWDLLLHKRPRSDDDMAMSAWLMKVMAVSDPAHSVNFIKLEQVYGQLPSKGRKRGRKDDSNENGHGHQDASSHRSWENRETKGAAGSTELFLSADEADSSLSDSSCQDDEKPPAKK